MGWGDEPGCGQDYVLSEGWEQRSFSVSDNDRQIHGR